MPLISLSFLDVYGRDAQGTKTSKATFGIVGVFANENSINMATVNEP